MNTASIPGIVIEEIRSYRSNGAITKFAIVSMSNSVTGDCALPASANDEYRVGVANFAVADNKELAVVVKGTMEVVAGGAIARGANVVVNGTSGRVKTDPESTGSISHIVGKALTPATTAGDHLIIEINLMDKAWET